MNIATMYEALLAVVRDRPYEILLTIGYAMLCLYYVSKVHREGINSIIYFLAHLVVTVGYGIAVGYSIAGFTFFA